MVIGEDARLVGVSIDGKPARAWPKRYAEMVRVIAALMGPMDGMRAGELRLHFNGNSVGPGLTQSWGPGALTGAEERV